MTYNENTALLDLLRLQLKFQDFMLTKRGLLTPSNNNVSIAIKMYEACYHHSCMNVELHECHNQYQIDSKQQNYDKTIEESIDAWLFFLNILLYADLLPTKKLIEYNQNDYDILSEQTLQHCMLEVMLSVSKLLYEMRFKKWKQTEVSKCSLNLIEYVDDCIVAFVRLFSLFKLTVEDIFQLSCKKININFERQSANGKYAT